MHKYTFLKAVYTRTLQALCTLLLPPTLAYAQPLSTAIADQYIKSFPSEERADEEENLWDAKRDVKAHEADAVAL